MQKIVMFDFDGVLVDSFELSYQAAQSAGSPLSREQQRKIFEGNFYEVLKKLKQTITKQDEKRYYSKYVPALFETPPIEGIEEVLRILSKSFGLVVISSTVSSPIQGYLNTYKLDRYFDWILGGDVHKSKSTKMKMVLQEYKVGPQDCIFITDTLGDMKEAKICNVQSIGVTWGFHEKERLAKGDFFMIIDTVKDLQEAVLASFALKGGII
jgi:phosphoglycolate phosphatase